MSLNAALPRPRPRLLSSRALRRLAIGAAALAVVAALVALVAAVGFSAAAPAPAPKNPFGTGLREAAPAATGLGGFILGVQSQFYRALTGALGALRQDGAGLPGLLAIGFAYGVFHGAGPGHGKGIISGYLMASRRTLWRGLALSFAAAALQAAVAIAIVLALAGLVGTTAAAINRAAGAIETASFAAVLGIGLLLLWRRTGRVVPAPGLVHRPGEPCECCEGGHMPAASAVERARTGREAAGIVLAAGLRPCSGAIILLVFALSQGLLVPGLAAVAAMAFGTALTTGTFASVAVLAKSFALRLASGRPGAGRLVPWLEVGAAALVTVFGALLLAGATGGG